MQDRKLCFGVKICGDLIEQQNFRVCRDRACDRKQLPLPLRKQIFSAGCIISLFQLFNDRVQSYGLCSGADHFLRNGRIKQRNLIPDISGNHTKALFDISENLPVRAVRYPVRILSVYKYLPLIRRVQSQYQFENRRFSGAGSAGEIDPLAFVHAKRQITQDILSVRVAEGYVGEQDGGRILAGARVCFRSGHFCRGGACGCGACGCARHACVGHACVFRSPGRRLRHLLLCGTLGLRKKLVDPVDACSRGLDGLNFHAD